MHASLEMQFYGLRKESGWLRKRKRGNVVTDHSDGWNIRGGRSGWGDC